MDTYFRVIIKSRGLEKNVILELNDAEIVIESMDGHVGVNNSSVVVTALRMIDGRTLVKPYVRMGSVDVSYGSMLVESRPTRKNVEKASVETEDKRRSYYRLKHRKGTKDGE